MKSPEADMLINFLRRRIDLGFCILEYPLDIFLDPKICRRHRSLLTMSQLFSRIDAVCFEGVEEMLQGFGERVVRSNDVGNVMCDILERSKVINIIEAKKELNRQVIGDILFDLWVVSTYTPELLDRCRFHVVVAEVEHNKYLEIASRLGVNVHIAGEGQQLFLREICVGSIGSVYIDCARYEDLAKIEGYSEIGYAYAPIKLENAQVIILHEGDKPKCRYSVSGEAVEIYECNKHVILYICTAEGRCFNIALRYKGYKSLDHYINI
ncbi:MAG: hypothetical protein RQ885_02155 [Desulfurococcales archaeon]|nr:hypothetical protein [Desulfurococcales archaeon]